MAWVKLDDAMPHHPKVVKAGPLAFALDVAGIAYSNRYETRGFIADGVLGALLPGLTTPRKYASRLVEAGRWERDEAAGGYHIHDIEDYQLTPEQREEREESKRAKALAGNHKRWHVDRGVTDPDCPLCSPNGRQAVPRESPDDSPNDSPRESPDDSSRESQGTSPRHPQASPVPVPEPGLDLETSGFVQATSYVGAEPPPRDPDDTHHDPTAPERIEDRHWVHRAQGKRFDGCSLCDAEAEAG